VVRAERSTIRLVTADTTGLVRARARCVRIGVSQPPEKSGLWVRVALVRPRGMTFSLRRLRPAASL
jgi:hypothetical protein